MKATTSTSVTPKAKHTSPLPSPPLPLPPGATDEEHFKYFYACAMIGHYSQFEVARMENSDGLIMDAVTPSLDYYRKESEAKADTTYEVWMERRSQHLSECCAMAAMHALEQLEIYRTKQTF